MHELKDKKKKKPKKTQQHSQYKTAANVLKNSDKCQILEAVKYFQIRSVIYVLKQMLVQGSQNY